MHVSEDYTQQSRLAASYKGWESVLKHLRQIERGKVSMLVSYDLDHLHGRIHTADNVACSYRRSYAELYAAHDPWAVRVRDLALPGSVWSGDQIISNSERVKSRYYKEWLKPQGIDHIVRGVVSRDQEEILFVDVGRTAKEGDYSEKEIDTYRALLPKLQHGARLRLVLDNLRRCSEAAALALDMLPVGVLVVDSDDHPVLVNRYAREILSGLQSTSENLLSRLQLQLGRDQDVPEKIRSLRLHQRAPASQMSSLDRIQPITISRPNGLSPLSGLVVHTTITGDNCVADGSSYLVLISDPDYHVALNRRRLEETYGLTPAEARLAALLAEGKRLKTAATELGISFETARTHLKRIFHKTTSQSQVDLVRVLLNLANQIGSLS
jgi:DNA-binding CsgD family transcriptional regulator/PAS domain-containing protein